MCGIAGIWDFKQNSHEAEIMRMTDRLAHRGPDDSGCWSDPKTGIYLGHRRLSILDLSPRGRQPMANDDQSLWITYNGEVYNFRELRSELESKGYTFTSDSDTEVVLKAYEAWGAESFSRFRGMFAFGLWDVRRRELLLVRDRIGVKPLYYYLEGGLLLFASELKAFREHPAFPANLDMSALSLYLQMGYVPGPLSIYTHTRKVQPGHYLRISEGAEPTSSTYWELADCFDQPPVKKPLSEVEEELSSIFKEAFSYRMVADVPVGVFLSGGMDSSLVAAVLSAETSRKLRTFTVSFSEEDWDESGWAAAVARHLGTEHATLTCSPEEALEIVPRLPDIYDEPFGDNSAVPTYLLSRAVRKHVKVALSGDGGDEFFFGYTTYTKLQSVWNKVERLPMWLRSALAALFRSIPEEALERACAPAFRVAFPHISTDDLRDKLRKSVELMGATDFLDAYRNAASAWSSIELRKLAPTMDWKAPFEGFSMDRRDPAVMMTLIDGKTFQPDEYLVKTDRASMAVGLEVREPMLDHKLIEYACSLPLQYKYAHGMTKYCLRRVLYRYLPRELVDRPKHGFGVPLRAWLTGPLRPLLREYLDPARIRREGLFSPETVAAVTNDLLSGARINPKKVWYLLMFELWYDRWLKN
jgi:asparagine synthase (glutamine-hydrolysing)